MKLKVLLLLVLCSCFAYLFSQTLGNLQPFQPEPQHKIVSTFITQVIGENHYKPTKLDDKLSAQIYDNFLKNLDNNKLYFTAADIKEFEKFKYSLDNNLQEGNLTDAYHIYNVYLKRIDERIAFANKALEGSFDFTKDDTYQIDRENSNWCEDQKCLDQLWQKKLTYEALNEKTTGKDSFSYKETLKKRYNNFKDQLGKTKSEDIFQFIMNSFTEVVDPHTNYFSPRTSEDFKINMSLSLEGIGATLQTENEYTKVKELVKGGPAEKSKQIIPNDRIIAVAQGKDGDFEDVVGWRIDDVVSRIRGAKGTVVRLKILSADAPANAPAKIVILTRDKIKLEDQASKGEIQELSRGKEKIKVGVITIPAFYLDFAGMQRGDKDYKSTTKDVKKILENMKKQNVQGVVIDLRNNGGGSLHEAIELTGLFIKTGPVVQVRNADGSINVEKDQDPDLVYDGPITVLVNRFSASASEIFAGAVQDYKRGLVVGEKTYGKGTVQSLVDIGTYVKYNDAKLGQLKLTIAKFYRINGSSTQHKGIIPDVELPSIFADAEYGEDASPYALEWDQIRTATYTEFAPVYTLTSNLKMEHEKRLKSSMEYKYLLQDIEEMKKAKEKKFVSLNEQKFRQEQEEARKLKNLREDERKSRSGESKGSDLILNESKEIIADLLLLKN